MLEIEMQRSLRRFQQQWRMQDASEPTPQLLQQQRFSSFFL
jgi:hypothetical protein